MARKKQPLKQIIEALLFSSPHALSAKQIRKVLGEDYDFQQIRESILVLNQEYEKTQRAFRIVDVAGGYQLRTLSEFKTWIQRNETVKPIKLSLSVIESLAIIAYKQPVTRAGIEAIRGVDSSYALRMLMDKRLIKVLGKEPVPGRPSLYGTTPLFLEVFGLKDIKSLPALSELKTSEPVNSEQLELLSDTSV